MQCSAVQCSAEQLYAWFRADQYFVLLAHRSCQLTGHPTRVTTRRQTKKQGELRAEVGDGKEKDYIVRGTIFSPGLEQSRATREWWNGMEEWRRNNKLSRTT